MIPKQWPQRNWTSIIVIILTILTACMVRKIFLSAVGSYFPYVTFYPAVTLAAIYGGLYAGIATVILSMIVALSWIIGFNQIATFTITNWIVQFAFPIIGLLISYSIETMYRIRDHDKKNTNQLLAINEELMRQKQNYQTLVENLPFIITRFDRKLRYQYANPLFEKVNNQKASDILNKTWQDLGNPPENYELLTAHFNTVFETKEILEYENVQTSPAETKYYHNIIVPEYEKDGMVNTVLVITHDLTLQHQIQKELLRLDRLNIIGEMAASIGHELRNPLTTVRGYLQYFSVKKFFPQYDEQFITMIEELDRANSIITEFLSLAKNKTVTIEASSLNDNISAIAPLLQADAFLSGHTINLELSEIPTIDIDKKEIRQVLLNLVRNAVEATPPGATITVKTGLINNQVALSVQDTGPGIPKDILEKLGTPFVTTKDKGTGLGLPVCYRIADRHHAKLEIITGPTGTTFCMKFKQ